MLYLLLRVFIIVFALTAATYSQRQTVNERLASTLNNEGVTLFAKGEPDEAIKSINRAIELFPTSPVFYRNLGIVYREQKDLTRSEAAFRQAIALKPDHAITHNQLGAVLLDTTRYAEALEAFRKADSLRPNDPVIC